MACPISFSSSTSLSLKTPFVDAQTERRGLQRRVSNRRKITEEEFGAAVKKRQTGGKCDDKNALRPNMNIPILSACHFCRWEDLVNQSNSFTFLVTI